MTVTYPLSEENYTGNGVITAFEVHFEQINDSTIEVIVDDIRTEQWHVEGDFVVFDTAPAAGELIKIYRRTRIHMPENYRPFGRFNGEKTELGMDRATMILQERNGTAVNDEPPNGFVGGNNISALPVGEGFGILLVNEKGTDVGIPVWATDPAPPPPPDPTIVWGEGGVGQSGQVARAFGDQTSGTLAFVQITFFMDFDNQIPNEAAVQIPNYYTGQTHVGWVNVDPDDGDYYCRVFEVGSSGNGKVQIRDQLVGIYRNLGDEFRMWSNETNPDIGTYISVDTNFEPAPATAWRVLSVEICKTKPTGGPDGNWAKQNVFMEATYNV